jgi:hypothetical protein
MSIDYFRIKIKYVPTIGYQHWLSTLPVSFVTVLVLLTSKFLKDIGNKSKGNSNKSS